MSFGQLESKDVMNNKIYDVSAESRINMKINIKKKRWESGNTFRWMGDWFIPWFEWINHHIKRKKKGII